MPVFFFFFFSFVAIILFDIHFVPFPNEIRTRNITRDWEFFCFN